jgi:hypothetical protein
MTKKRRTYDPRVFDGEPTHPPASRRSARRRSLRSRRARDGIVRSTSLARCKRSLLWRFFISPQHPQGLP